MVVFSFRFASLFAYVRTQLELLAQGEQSEFLQDEIALEYVGVQGPVSCS